MWTSSTGPYPSEGTTKDMSASFASLPPPNPARPITFTPICFAASTAARILGELPEAEIAARLGGWQPPQPRYRTGAFAKYAASVASASEGAITRPAAVRTT